MSDTHSHTPEIEVPVLIVGAGPAGLVASLSLARHGVGHLTVERHPSTAQSRQMLFAASAWELLASSRMLTKHS